MLHIVNGDSVGEKLRQGNVYGDILVWREVYPHGPVFEDLRDASNSAVRADYLERTLGVPLEEYIRGCQEQEEKLDRFRQHEKIVLWFEHDLFDQAMLCYLLHYFAGHNLGDTRLSLLCIGEYPGIEPFRGLGQLSVQQLASLAGQWQVVSAEQLALGSALWQAFASADPRELHQLIGGDTSALPFAHDAFEAHLSRLPSTYNGLGTVEQATLVAVRSGVSKPHEMFQRVGDKLHMLGMGDLEYWYILARMSQEPYALLRTNGGFTAFPRYNESPNIIRDCKIAITDLGSKVLEGSEDWTALRGIDVWYGGLHLQGTKPRWRWDSDRRTIRGDSPQSC